MTSNSSSESDMSKISVKLSNGKFYASSHNASGTEKKRTQIKSTYCYWKLIYL